MTDKSAAHQKLIKDRTTAITTTIVTSTTTSCWDTGYAQWR